MSGNSSLSQCGASLTRRLPPDPYGVWTEWSQWSKKAQIVSSFPAERVQKPSRSGKPIQIAAHNPTGGGSSPPPATIKSLEIKRFQGFFLFSNRKGSDQVPGIICTKFSRFGVQNLVQKGEVSVDLKTPAAFCAENRVRQALLIFREVLVRVPFLRELCLRTWRLPRSKSMSSYLRPRNTYFLCPSSRRQVGQPVCPVCPR